jgi:hypothetical protein
MLKGRLFVIGFVVVFVLAIVGTTIARYMLEDRVGLNQAGIGLGKVQKAAAVWAAGNEGRYPQHIALLQANNYFRATLLIDPRLPEGTVWTVGGFDARRYLEEVILHDDQQRLDRTPLLEAVANDPEREAPIYRFGDYFFVRLAKATADPRIIFGWTLPDDEDRRFIVYDDGEPRRVDPAQWGAAWDRDAAARAELGLPAIQRP